MRVPGVSRKIPACWTSWVPKPNYGECAEPTVASMPAHVHFVAAATGSASGPTRTGRAGGAVVAAAVVTLPASSSSRDDLAGKLESISHASSDDGQRAELQKGLDQADQHLSATRPSMSGWSGKSTTPLSSKTRLSPS